MGVRGSGGGPVTLRIEGLAAGGRGVARHEGRVWFVDDAFPGDEVRAEPVRLRPRFVEARVVRVERPAPERREAPCAHQGRCGGCPWMPWPEPGQRVWKQRILAEALARIGGLEHVAIEPIRAPTPALGYRNRVEFTVAAESEGRRWTVGLHGRRSHELVPIDRCLLQDGTANRVLAVVRETLVGLPVGSPGGAPADARWRVTLRRSERHDDRVVLVREERHPFPRLERLALDWMRGVDEPTGRPLLSGVVRRRGAEGRRGGGSWETVAGAGELRETLAGIPFLLPPGTFTQVHAAAAEALAELIVSMAGRVAGRHVLDLYGGVGLYGLVLGRAGARSVTVVDADGEAVRCGAAAAREAGIDRVRHQRGDVGAWLARPGRRPDLVVVNPPRGGMDRSAAERLARSGAPLIVVSCDPATLARDLKRLTAGGRLRPVRVVPLDLFPQTPHLETVVRLDPA